MAHHMAAVVQNDIGRTNSVQDALQELRILLRPDIHLDLIFLKFLTVGVYVYANDFRVRAKITLPHLQRAATPAADLHERYRSVYKSCEMPFVDREIVLPFVNDSLVVIQKLRPKVHRLIVTSHRRSAISHSHTL